MRALTELIRKKSTIKRNFFNVVPNIANGDVNWENAVPYEEIPGPKPLPGLGNTWRFIPYVGDFNIEHMDKVCMNLYKKYGNVVKMEGLLGRPDMLFLFDPNLIEKVYREEDSMPHRPSMPSLSYYKHVYKRKYFGENAGVISVHGEQWQKFRSKVNKIMLQPGAVHNYVDTVSEAADEFIKRIEILKNSDGEVPSDFLNEIHKWSLESLARIALDAKLNCLNENSNDETQKLIDAICTFFMCVPELELKFPLWKLIPTPTFKKYINALDIIHEICTKYIQQALEKTTIQDEKNGLSVLQQVLTNQKEKETAINLALDLFLVGIDTTSNAVASILYQLAIHEDKQEKLYDELLENICEENFSLQNLHYLRACIRETLRMYPVVIGNGRCLTEDSVIGGYQVPKGVQVVFQHYVASNLDTYFTNSSTFLPERWLNKNMVVHKFASLPFGFGRRMCLGKRFADLEMQILIAKIILKYKVTYEHQKLDYHIHPMYKPNGLLKFKFKLR